MTTAERTRLCRLGDKIHSGSLRTEDRAEAITKLEEQRKVIQVRIRRFHWRFHRRFHRRIHWRFHWRFHRRMGGRGGGSGGGGGAGGACGNRRSVGAESREQRVEEAAGGACDVCARGSHGD